MLTIEHDILRAEEMSPEGRQLLEAAVQMESDAEKLIGLLYEQPDHRIQHVQIGAHVRKLMELEQEENTERWRRVAYHVVKSEGIVVPGKSAKNKVENDIWQLQLEKVPKDIKKRLLNQPEPKTAEA